MLFLQAMLPPYGLSHGLGGSRPGHLLWSLPQSCHSAGKTAGKCRESETGKEKAKRHVDPKKTRTLQKAKQTTDESKESLTTGNCRES